MDAASVPKSASSSATAAAGKSPSEITSFTTIRSGSERRTPTGLREADRVFGGGIVTGSVTLLGGEPGIGKSTLALMLSAMTAKAGGKVIYASGEESPAQVKSRADRLKLAQDELYFLGETDVDAIIATLTKERPVLAIIDSVQMLRSDDIPSEAGAVGQVRGAAGRLVAFAKSSSTALLLIGHVTKDGTVAGPKTLEHLVDTVLSFEGERTHPLRILRSTKNRFGSTDEAGIFEMQDDGLAEVANPSAYLLEARRAGIPGSAIACIIEGTRPVLIEVQALVQKTSFGYPARKSSGFDASRLEMLLAVLSRRSGIDFSQHDVYLNVVGGLKIKEPAADLAVALALASAHRHVPLAEGLVAWGEVGLGGEIRPVPSSDRRLAEAAALGMTRALLPLPKSGLKRMPKEIAITDAKTIKEALASLEPAMTASRP
jgi:DNA repair protein RadA/Sms